MTNQQILEKAIKKAIDGGWKRDYRVKYSFVTKDTSVDDWDTYAPIIFSHDFAKALWGEEPKRIIQWVTAEDGVINMDDGKVKLTGQMLYNYKFHLQQMVISDDPIKYLGEHL